MMRKALIFCLALTLVAAFSLPQAFAGGKGKQEKPDKVFVCHVDLDDVVENPFSFFTTNVTIYRGHVIHVSENALDAHLAHGDCSVTEGDKGAPCTCESSE